ncbi:MAG: hypothetical protein WC683_01830 [bacterium]
MEIKVGTRIHDNDPRCTVYREGKVIEILSEERVLVKWFPRGRTTRVKKSRIRPRAKARSTDYVILEEGGQS